MKAIGILLLIAGIGIASYFQFVYDPSVEVPTTYINGYGSVGGGRVMNLERTEDRRNGFITGCILFIVGVGLSVYAFRRQTPQGVAVSQDKSSSLPSVPTQATPSAAEWRPPPPPPKASASRTLETTDSVATESASMQHGMPFVSRCPACSALNSVDSRFCSECGVNLIESCPTCKTENRVGTRYCGKCGADLVKLRQVAEYRRQVADLESRASIAARDEAISPLIAARDVLKNLLGLSPTDTEAVQQVRTIEGRLRALFLERASGQREHEAMATYRELLQHLPGDTEATAKLSRLEEKKSARSRRRMAITAGVAVVVIAFLGLLRYVAQVQTDERGWTTAATAADAAGVNYEQAIQQYRQYLDQFPQGRHASQAREFVEVILPQQIDDQAWKLACTGAEAAGAKYDAAIQQYTQYLSHFPQGRYASKAKELVEVALPQQIDDQAWKATTTAAEEAGPNYELAIQQYRQYIDRFPQGRHVTTAKQLVEVALPQQILDRKYRTAVKDASNYLRLKDWVNADQAIRRALEMKPDGAESAQLREEQLKMVDDLREQQYQEGLSHAQASMAGGEPEAAVEFCRAALAAKPNDPTALQVLRDATESSKRAKVYGDAMSQARSLLDQQNWTEALAAVNTALSTVPQDKAALAFKDKIKESEINAHYQEAIIEAKSHLSQQEWDAASSSCNRALTYKPDDQDAKTLLAVITKAAHDAINSIPDLDPAEVIKQVWGKGAGTTDQLERRFAKKYAGQKVKYQGTVDDILENEGSVIFKGGGTWPQNYKIKATLGPTNRSKLQTLSKGQSLLVIGELKGLKAAAFGIGANVILISVPD